MSNIHVYQWFNINTLEYYIGYTLGKVKNYICSSKHVKPRIKENPNEWHKTILGYFETGHEARAFEEDCIRSMWGDKLLLNRSITGKEFTTAGKKFSAEHIEKLKNADRSKWKLSEEGRQSNINSKLGKPRSEETKRKLREANLGKKISEETKLKISLTSSGRRHTEQSKEKLRAKAIGRLHSEETKNKLSEIAKNREPRKHSDETKKKISENAKKQKRFPTSEETKKKISESMKKSHEKKRNKNVLQ